MNDILNRGIGTEYHYSGTAAMLPLELGGVVDSELRVYGTSNLRIVDISIFSVIPGAHLQAVVYAVAEKAADIIKGNAEESLQELREQLAKQVPRESYWKWLWEEIMETGHGLRVKAAGGT